MHVLNESEKIAVVVLAYSRDKLLRKLIDALRNQTRSPDDIIVINQGQDKSIASWLAEQKDLIVIAQENKGSAGGFCKGIEESIVRGYAWIWIFDDDAIPESDALEKMTETPYYRNKETVFLGSRIVDRYGKTYMSPGGGDSQAWYATVLKDGCVEAQDACWLGLLVRSSAVCKVGLPIAEFFLWDEDREFVSRLVQEGKGYCVLNSIIMHFQVDEFDAFGDDFIKIAYYARNHVARAKLGTGSFVIKVLRTVRTSSQLLLRVVKREWPLRTIPWIFKGAFLFWPKIRYPKTKISSI